MDGGRKNAGYCDVVTVAVITWLLERGDEMSILDVVVIAIAADFVIGIICFCLEESDVIEDGDTVSRVVQNIFNLVLVGWYVSVDMGWI